MAVSLGISPIAWSNDDLVELGGDITLDRCLQDSKDIGFVAIEKGGKFPNDKHECKDILDKYSLKLASGWFGGRLLNGSIKDEIEAIKSHKELFLYCKAPLIVYADVTNSIQSRNIPISKKPKIEVSELKKFAKKLDEFARYMKDDGLALSYHHHMGTIVENKEEIDIIMRNTKELNLLFDTGHIEFAGDSALDLIKEYKDRINHIHLKDIRKSIKDSVLKEDKSFVDAVVKGVFTVPSDGYMDYEAIFKEINKMNYDGYLIIEAEQDPKKANPYEYSKKGFLYTKELCSKFDIDIKE